MVKTPLFGHGFRGDVTATDDESRQEPELAVLRKGFALVLTAEEIAARLAGGGAGAVGVGGAGGVGAPGTPA
ncbi:hypothetical protein [Streptomyces sp. RK9]|uniref:hypothetical protein n=1 Tax=Streptomyces sp. RK9 TaxID=3239284 RepID=UPI003864C45C